MNGQQNYHMLANSTLILQSDPFEFLMRDKTGRNMKQQRQKSIKLNLNRLPPDFFPRKRIRRLQSHSERSPCQNQFLPNHKTLELRSERKVSSQTKQPKQINPFSMKRQSICSSRVADSRHMFTEPQQDCFEGFNCTFAKKMNREYIELKKVQFPIIMDQSRKGNTRPMKTCAVN